MKKVLRDFFIVGALVFMGAGCFAQKNLNAADSEPAKMGWMQGFPPAKDKIISAADGSFFVFPALRYSVNHIREFYPTREVKAAKLGSLNRPNRRPSIIPCLTIPWSAAYFVV